MFLGPSQAKSPKRSKKYPCKSSDADSASKKAFDFCPVYPGLAVIARGVLCLVVMSGLIILWIIQQGATVHGGGRNLIYTYMYIYICCLKSVSVLPCEQLEDWDSRREMDVEAGS